MLKTTIPFADLKGRDSVDLLRLYPDKARALGNGRRRLAVARLTARKDHAWLRDTFNPYLHEVESCAEVAGASWLHTLNTAPGWGGSGGVYRSGDSVGLLRVMSAGELELGRLCVAVRNESKLGEYTHIGWPGLAGVFHGMAPGRFAAAVIAPPRQARLLARRAVIGLPPSHALRRVFEQAGDYAAARGMLHEIPLSEPAIFLLAGVRQGEGSLIERVGERAQSSDLGAAARLVTAGHFSGALPVPGLLPADEDAKSRLRHAATLHGHDLAQPGFDWLGAPLRGNATRLCLALDAGTGRLLAQGFGGHAPVTAPLLIAGRDTLADDVDELPMLAQV